MAQDQGEAGERDEADLWFLPGPSEEEPPLPGRSRGADRRMASTEAGTGAVRTVAAWRAAEAGLARPLAQLAWRLGALDARLALGPQGWRHRLGILEAAELSWFAGDRVAADRITLWVAQRISAVNVDTRALARAGWAFRRLVEGPGPEDDLAAFLGRHEVEGDTCAEPLSDSVAAWKELLAEAGILHPLSRAALGYWSWSLAGLDRGPGAPLEAAVTAARLARPEPARALPFVPLAFGGAGDGLRLVGGSPEERLRRWISGAEAAAIAALRHLEALEHWHARAVTAVAGRSGRTPPRLIAALVEWPLLSAPMAEEISGVSRASVHRNFDLLAGEGLIREVTGQGRFRFWSVRVDGPGAFRAAARP